MMEYKLYCFGDDGHVIMRHDYPAHDDLTALELAKRFNGRNEVEIWQVERFVARIKPDGTASFTQPVAQSA